MRNRLPELVRRLPSAKCRCPLVQLPDRLGCRTSRRAAMQNILYGTIFAVALVSFITGMTSFAILVSAMLESPPVPLDKPVSRFADDVLSERGRRAKRRCVISSIVFQLSIIFAIAASIVQDIAA